MEEGYGVDIIYLDYRQAFDTVHHGRLIDKLISYGVDVNNQVGQRVFVSEKDEGWSARKLFRMSRCAQWCTSRLCVGPFTLSDFVE